ncbi:MAG: hypothetical protein OEZ16_12450, partial [Chromatiales bacterium]|nr:hypothetical protein [Chromatiales bacterium]
AFAEPSHFFMTESAATAANGSASLAFDYINTTASNSGNSAGARVGAFGGEVMINTLPNHSATGFNTPHIGYKTNVMPNLSAYGIFSHYNDPAPGTDPVNDFAIGAAYTIDFGTGKAGVDAQLITDNGFDSLIPGSGNGRGGDTTIFVKGAGQFDIPNIPSKVGLIGEIILENNDALYTMVNLGVRWNPMNNVTADFVLYHDDGSNLNDSMTGIPGAVRLSITF